MQLLSTGSFVYAVPSDNNASCYAPTAANVTLNGDWTTEQIATAIAGTEQDIETALVDVGTPSSEAPSIIFEPYVSASGQYQVNMLIPGCNALQDCALRTSVKVTVFPGGNLQPVFSNISQQNTEDASVSIYSGPVIPSPPNFVMTVTMDLADQPIGTGQNGQYRLIADRLELQLLSANVNGMTNSTTGNITNTISTAQAGFGFFEWPLSSKSSVTAETSISNTSETTLDNIAFAFFNATGGASGAATTKNTITSIAFHSSGIYLGGSFNISAGANIVVYQNGQLKPLSEGGLNGQVNSMVIDGNTLFVGGSFDNTMSSSLNGKAQGVVSYNIGTSQWVPLQAGVDGPVQKLSFLDNELAVAGSFATLLSNVSSSQLGTSAGGFAIWSISNGTWINTGGFVTGSMTFIGNGTTPSKGQQQAQILAGNIAASLQFGAPGVVMLQNGPSNDNNLPDAIPLNIQLDGVAQTTGTQSLRKRYSHKRSSWVSSLRLSHIFSRQSTSVSPLPPSPVTPAPAVLAGIFWTNTSNSHEVMIIGGNFSATVTSGLTEAVIFYDLTTGEIAGLVGSPLNGTVRTLLVSGTSLYIGGEFSVSGSGVSGLAIVDLTTGQLDMSGLQPLQSTSGPVILRSLTSSTSQSNAIFAAGTFNSAGGVNCEGICRLDTNSKQWSQLGSGINGEITSVSYAGVGQKYIF